MSELLWVVGLLGVMLGFLLGLIFCGVMDAVIGRRSRDG